MSIAGSIARSDAATSRARRAMVDNQIRTYDVTNQRVLEAFYTVPRDRFVAPAHADLSYSDAVLSVTGSAGAKRTLLVPMTLARMIQALDPVVSDRVLVVGGTTGYPVAILAMLSAHVVALESDDGFVESTRSQAALLGLGNVEAVLGPLNAGWPAGKPYDLILICGSVERGIEPLMDQLAPKGRLVAIQTESHGATTRAGKVTLYEKTDSDVSSRAVFDATAPVLDAFRQPPSFVF